MLPFRRFPLSRLLPSWWMAPWFLMLLSFCSSLFSAFEIRSSNGIRWPIHEGGLCEGGIIQLTMPALKPVADLARLQVNQRLVFMTQVQLNKDKRWQTIYFTGNGINDFIGLDNTRQYLQTLDKSNSYEVGVRIKFSDQTSYACFMEVLSIVWTESKWYWLDVRHEPMTLYVVNLLPELLPNQ